MLNSGKKIRTINKINILTLVLSEKKIMNETKNHTPPPPPPRKLNGRSLNLFQFYFLQHILVNLLKTRILIHFTTHSSFLKQIFVLYLNTISDINCKTIILV